MESSLFEGFVSHNRTTSVQHRFQYRTFMVLLDLDNLDSIFSRSRLWSRECWNWAAFYRKDYINPAEADLKTAVVKAIAERCDEQFQGRIFLLTHVRYLGYCFNPVSFYFCYDNQQLSYILAEVNNTPWNERFHYVLKCNPDTGQHQHFEFNKEFHVSPFNPMDMLYRWDMDISEQQIRIHMKNLQQGHTDFQACLNLTQVCASKSNLNRFLIRYPAETLKTLFGIYWQALKLKMKGAKFHNHTNSNKDKNYGNLSE